MVVFCTYCGEPYEDEESDSTAPSLFCSQDCEGEKDLDDGYDEFSEDDDEDE